MFKQKTHYILIGILILAAILRLWQIGTIPSSPDWDEAAYGYNAYSVIHTGKDEFGAMLPVVLRSFDDYKPALYLYLVIPFVWLLGITTEAVRLPSAISGIVTVYMTYVLIQLLFKRKDLALLTAFLLAISPWHIQFSRIGFEANVGVLLNVSMVYCFLRGIKQPRFFVFSAIFGGLSLYAYQSEKVFTPLLALTLLCLYWKDLKGMRRSKLVMPVIVGLLVVAPMLWYLGTNAASLTRARETSIFADKANLNKNALRLDADLKAGDTLGRLLDNRRVFYATKIVDGYMAHFSLKWLFITGDNNPRHHAPAMSLLYLVELPFLLLGIYSLLFLPFDKKSKWLVFIWFLLAPVPASITSGVPHAVRTINFLPLFQLFIATGLLAFYGMTEKWRKTNKKYTSIALILYTGFALLAFGNFFYYLNQYFVQMNPITSKDWQYGYTDAVPFIDSVSDRYEKIVVSNIDPLDQSYIFFLYYLQFAPREYQQNTKNGSGGFAETHAFGKYEFRPIDWNKEKRDGKTLYVGRPQDFPEETHNLKMVRYLNGLPAIRIVDK